ncbi:MAG: CobD/CbiB family cobalamin biosynthesis protein, partial [Paeniclostridium sordellii]|nr:CobD/CbiB family cobalamin biosynthesis protein [Paeniclostridium sordellii]
MSSFIISIMCIAYILDLIIGDPYSFPHPVRFIGNLIRFIENEIRKISKSNNQLKIGGFILWLLTVGITFLVTYLILRVFSINKILFFIISSLILYTTLSTKCLADEAKKIYNVLKTGDIEKSRKQLSYIVG